MADGGLSLLIASTVASAGVGVASQISAKNAADAQSEANQDLLDRRQQNERQAMVENSKRQQANKNRYLAQLRAQQAANGGNTQAGTPLAVFGDIENRYDEEINEATNRALDSLGQIESQKQNLRFGDRQRSAAMPLNMAAIGIGAATKFASGYGANYDRFGKKADPFGIFKNQQ